MTVSRPCRAVKRAAERPATPPPTMATSQVVGMGKPVTGNVINRAIVRRAGDERVSDPV
jgi:hypothetical protein